MLESKIAFGDRNHMIYRTTKSVAAIALLSLSCTSTIASANEDDVIVIGSRVPVEQHKLGKSITVIDSEQLEMHQERYVADALRMVPGLAVSRAGSFGGYTEVRVRGAEANHVLILVDGLEISSTTDGGYDLSGLQVANIDRIEVLRGPQSAFWGSNATAGVINIITKKGVSNHHQAQINAEIGDDGTRQTALALSGGMERFDYALSGAFRETDGFNISDFGDEDDGDINRSINGKINLELTDNITLNVTGRKASRSSASDDQDYTYGSPTQGLVLDTDSTVSTEEQSVSVGLTADFDSLIHTLRIEQDSNNRELSFGDGSEAGSDSIRKKAVYQVSYRFGPSQAVQSLTGGVEYEKEKFRNTFPSELSQEASQDRELRGYIIQYSGDYFDRFFLTSAVRFDDNDKFKDSRTFNISAALLPFDHGTRFHGAIGTGVSNPTFYEQFGYIPSAFEGNENLEPEENKGWELGVEVPLFDERVVFDVTYFKEELRNEIVTNFPAPLYIGAPDNLNGKSHREGAELSLVVQPTSDLMLNLSYMYLEATEETDDGDETEARRPRNSGSLSVAYAMFEGKANVFLDAVYQGEMDDLEYINATPETRVEIADHWTVKVGSNFQVTENVEIYGRVENLLDEEYEEVFGYNTQGRAAFVGFRLNL